MLNRYLPIRFDGINLCKTETLWKQIIGLYIYEWDATPNAMTIMILGFEFHFLLGSWPEE